MCCMVLLKRIQSVLFIISPSTAALSHRKPGTSCSSCLKQGQDKERACGMAHITPACSEICCMVLLKGIQGVLFIISPNTATLSHRKPGTSCSSCLKQGQVKGRAYRMAHMNLALGCLCSQLFVSDCIGEEVVMSFAP
jgi:hypothetical protein